MGCAARQRRSEEWCSSSSGSIPQDAFLPLAEEEAEHYNENAPLGSAIQEAVAVAGILHRWPQGLRALSVAVGSESAEVLVQSAEALALPEGKDVTPQVMEGLCALMWARPMPDLDLAGRKLTPECLTMLGRALHPDVLSLSLSETDFAKGGNDLSGLRHLCAALRGRAGMRVLGLAGNSLGADAGLMLGDVIAIGCNKTLTSIECAANHCECFTP